MMLHDFFALADRGVKSVSEVFYLEYLALSQYLGQVISFLHFFPDPYLHSYHRIFYLITLSTYLTRTYVQAFLDLIPLPSLVGDIMPALDHLVTNLWIGTLRMYSTTIEMIAVFGVVMIFSHWLTIFLSSSLLESILFSLSFPHSLTLPHTLSVFLPLNLNHNLSPAQPLWFSRCQAYHLSFTL